MSRLEALKSDALSSALASPGITRHLAFQGKHYKIIRSRSDPGAISGWHHHGNYEVYGYVVSGMGLFESDSGQEGPIVVGPGDFFHVPPHTIHREINPSSDEENEFIMFLLGTGPLVYNIPNSDQS